MDYKLASTLLRTGEDTLKDLDETMSAKVGQEDLMEKFFDKNQKAVDRVLKELNLKEDANSGDIINALDGLARKHEDQLREHMKTIPGKDQFERAANFARQAANVGKGFFLKKEYGEEILRKRRPENLLAYLKLDSVDALLDKYDVTEAFSALRFMESNEWMHETFDEAYSHFTAQDFEEREIAIDVLGPEWEEVAKKFVAKKHHNVSHLKEFGVIFLNPIAEDAPGKFLRDSALLLHYFHEIEFYARLFRKYAERDDFAEHLKALLRGDVREASIASPGDWLIVQRYLWKEDPKDPRLSIPRVNPESMHWARGERDLVEFGKKYADIDLEFWEDLDWVATIPSGESDPVSFDMEDVAMTLVSRAGGGNDRFNYHQREAMWTELFSEYVGGEEKMEEMLIKNYDEGIIKL